MVVEFVTLEQEQKQILNIVTIETCYNLEMHEIVL